MSTYETMLLIKKNMNFVSLNNYKSIQVHERIAGNIKTKRLIIMHNGVLEGDVIADEIIVHGKIVGKIKCLSKLSITSTGSVDGDILYYCLNIQ